jgi:uncharacterized membrane protein
MLASIEAIFLSTFILISEDRMSAIVDLQISLLSEYEITRLLQLFSRIAEKLEIDEGDAPDLAELKQPLWCSHSEPHFQKARSTRINPNCQIRCSGRCNCQTEQRDHAVAYRRK